MASIFTYDPDPPRVASPWLQDGTTNRGAAGAQAPTVPLSNNSPPELDQNANRAESNSKVTRLQAEPQEGPVEYKLHLLLRPRRKFRSTSTGNHVSGSKHSRFGPLQSTRAVSESACDASPGTHPGGTFPQAQTQQTRQHRLEQLTTQLLWRLQQSSPHHSSSASNFILPSLPEALPELQSPRQPAKLLHGLEETQGALYEIGVADEGTLVGLAEDEMNESLNNLRAMAACLGCVVEVVRKEVVGECEWLEDMIAGRKERKYRRTGKLVVVEALIKPHLQSRSPSTPDFRHNPEGRRTDAQEQGQQALPATEQLRITLIGPTMSGKSSLLGTLTTSTLDNGRGQSRLSMLRHRHEINSGITSSVTSELLGYKDGQDGSIDVVNYAEGDMASWIDVHVTASGGRLVLISDSAGHPRYRRTTVKGLVGCAPHCILLCIPADDSNDAGGKLRSTNGPQVSLGSTVLDADISGAQLELCLRLGLPLVIVITKLDLASKTGLKKCLSKVLDALKAAGRKPEILRNTPGDVSAKDLQTITAATIEAGCHASLPFLNDGKEAVPIVLTSAVQGTGISNLHALLHELPIPSIVQGNSSSAGQIFHIEDVYSNAADVEGIVVSGRLRSGQISVGDERTLGPFSIQYLEDSEDSDERPGPAGSSHLPASRSFPGALRNAHLSPPHFQLPNQEWRRYKVTSVRNLRLPVHSLLPGQVGTLAIVPAKPMKLEASKAASARIRKGMVLATHQPRGTRSFVAEFEREDLESLAVGNHVVVYIASVRASARVVSARAPDAADVPASNGKVDTSEPFGFEEDNAAARAEPLETDGLSEKIAGATTAPRLLVTFGFEASKEFMVVGDQVLVMPGGGPGLYGGTERGEKGIAGLEGFVGWVREVGG